MLIGYTTNVGALQPLMRLLDDHLLTSSEVGAHLRYSKPHMSNLRKAAKGPPWIALPSGGIRYSMSAVATWQLSGESGALTLDRVSVAIAGCAAVPIEHRAAVIAHLETVFRPAP